MLKQSHVDKNKGIYVVQLQKSLEEVEREKECSK